MKLITELVEEDFNVIKEETEDGNKSLFVEGIFMQSDIKNRNGRVYPNQILEREVNRYIKSHVSQKRALGELGHPQGPKINEDRVSHLITNLRFEGQNVIGKAKILSTPMGNIAKALVEDGVKIGVSSRGIGSLKERNGINEVQDDFYLATVDIVTDPSGPDCFVNGIMEGVEFWYDQAKGSFIEKEVEKLYEDIPKKISKKDYEKKALRIFEWYLDNISKR